MRTMLFVLAIAVAAWVCSRETAPPTPARASTAARPLVPAPAPSPAPAPAPVLVPVSDPPAALRTGATGWLQVENDYPITQWIFVDDGTLLGTVAPGRTETFEVPAGRHRFSSTDSASPDDNPVRRTYSLRRGQTVSWRVYTARR